MRFYDTYHKNLAESSGDYYKNNKQAQVDYSWDDTTQLRIVEEQSAIGSTIYNKISVHADYYVDYSSTSMKNKDDFIRMSFRDFEHETDLGRYYKYDDSYWIVTNTSNHTSVISDCIVRRCNNFLKWFDKDTGKIISMPCVLDYNISATNPKVDKDINVLNSSLTVIVQGNEYTRSLPYNKRFIFNGVPYRFVAYNNYMQNSYIDDRATILYMDVDFDALKPVDDRDNNIADIKEFVYNVNIHENPIEQINGFKGKVTATVTLNGEAVAKDIQWSAINATINDKGEYTIDGEIGDTAILTATFGEFSQSVAILIVESLSVKSEIVISPLTKELNQSESVTLTAKVYRNGIAQADIVRCTPSGAQGCYTLVDNGNEFIITNIRMSKEPLLLTFNSGDLTTSINIKLKALF